MSSYNQIQTQWKDTWKWVKGSSNCKEEQECEITFSLFTKPVEPLFKIRQLRDKKSKLQNYFLKLKSKV
jgi:hypothetical protein